MAAPQEKEAVGDLKDVIGGHIEMEEYDDDKSTTSSASDYDITKPSFINFATESFSNAEHFLPAAYSHMMAITREDSNEEESGSVMEEEHEIKFPTMIVNLDRQCNMNFHEISELLQLGESWKQRKMGFVGRFWADIFCTDKEQQAKVEKAFRIHPLTSEDIFDKQKREKLEVFDHYMYIVFNERQIKPGTNIDCNIDVNILLFKDFILTLHTAKVDTTARVLYDLKYGISYYETVTMDWVLYKYLDIIIDEYFPIITSIEADINALDNFVDQEQIVSQSELLWRMGIAKKRIQKVTQDLLAKEGVVIGLTAEKGKRFITPETRIFLGDVTDHIKLLLHKLKVENERLQNINGTYLALLSIEVAEANSRMNKVMKRFSAVAVIFLPLTLIAGLWGMNVEVPFNAYPTGYGILWFALICIAMALYAVGAALYLRMKGWL